MCDDFSEEHIRYICKKEGIDIEDKTKSQLCTELIKRQLLPKIPKLTESCKNKPLARIKYQAKLLGLDNPEMYTKDTKQMLCNQIARALDEREIKDEFGLLSELKKDQMCVGPNLTTTEELKRKAKELNLEGHDTLDRSTLCYIIKKELTRLRRGGPPLPPLVTRQRKKKGIIENTYDRVVIPDEEKLNIPQLSRCLTTEQLRSEQILPAQYLSDPRNRGMLLAHSVGTGKTYAAINTAQVLLRKGIVDHVIVITPTSLQYNFINQFKKYNKDLATDPRYKYYTPTAFHRAVMNGRVQCEGNTLLIIDEAHNYRTNIGRTSGRAQDDGEMRLMEVDHADTDRRWTGGRVRAIFRFMRECPQVNKILLLSATPLVNSYYDLENLLAIMENRAPRPDMKSQLVGENMDDPRPLLNGRGCSIHVYKTGEEYKKDFPRVIQKREWYSMTPEYYKEYYKIQVDKMSGQSSIFKAGGLTVFYNGVRRAANKVDFAESDKLSAVIAKIREDINADPRVRILVYSSWIEAGLKAIQQTLAERGITSVSITGKLSKLERLSAVEKFNKGLASVLLISKAGGEGLDLKGTNKVYIVEPTWNDAAIQQVVGRAVRYKSHHDLPEEKRFVEIYAFILLKPFESDILGRAQGDPNMRELAKKIFKDPEVMGRYKETLTVGFDERINSKRKVTVIDKDGLVSTEEDDMMSIDLYLYKFMADKQTKIDKLMSSIEKIANDCHREMIAYINSELLQYRPPVLIPRLPIVVPMQVEEESAEEIELNMKKNARQLLGDDVEFKPMEQEPKYYKEIPVKRVRDIALEIRNKGTDALKSLAENKKVQYYVMLEARKVHVVIFYKSEQEKVVREKIVLEYK